MKTDFVVESGGNCFLCLEGIKHQRSLPFPRPAIKKQGQKPVNGRSFNFNSNSPLYSLQALSRYLKLDLWKVFVEDEQSDSDRSTVPKHILTKTDKLKLKGQLCKECACLIRKFKDLFRKLEQIEMEVLSSLELIQGKLLQKVNGTDSFLNGEFDILNVVRSDAMQKCSQKLSSASPKSRLRKLTLNQVIQKKHPLKNHSSPGTDDRQGRLPTDLLEEEHPAEPEIDIDIGAVKVEHHFLQPFHDEDEQCDMGSDASSFTDDNTVEDNWNESDDSRSIANPKRKVDGRKRRKKKPSGELIKKYTDFEIIPSAATTGTSIPEEPQFSLNPETGKQKCALCPSQFMDGRNLLKRLKIHHESVHLKLRYRCKLCKKEFAQRGHYYRHHEAVHVGVKFICKICSREFAHRHHLVRHRQNKSCTWKEPKAKTFFCQFPGCTKGFTAKQNLDLHVAVVHRQDAKLFECDFCGKKFKWQCNLGEHRRKIHPLKPNQNRKN